MVEPRGAQELYRNAEKERIFPKELKKDGSPPQLPSTKESSGKG